MGLQGALGVQIRVASTPTLSIHSMPPVIDRMLLDRPRLRIALQSLATPELLEQVRPEAVELGFTFGPVIDVGVTIQPLFEPCLACLMTADAPLAKSKGNGAAGIAVHRHFILPAQSTPGIDTRLSPPPTKPSLLPI